MSTTRKTAVQRIMEERENRSSDTTTAESTKSYYQDNGVLEELSQAASGLEEARSALLKSRDDQRVLENNAKAAENKYKALQGKLRSAWGLEQLESLRSEYDQTAGELSTAAKKAQADYDTYTQASSRYTAAKSRYDQWRSTIRDSETVKAELADVDSRITALKRLTRGRSDDLGESMRQSLKELESGRELLEEELDWSEHFYYADMTGKDDYKSLSGYTSTANGRSAARAPGGMYAETGFGNVVYDYINRNEEAARVQREQNSVQDLSYLEQMTDDEIGIYNYLYAKEGGQAAGEYLKYLKTDLTGRQRSQLEQTLAQQSRESPVAASALSVIAAPAKGLGALGQAADYLTDGEIDENAGYNRVSHMSSAIRGEVSSLVEEKWGRLGSAAYQLGMSMADSLANGFAGRMLGSGAAAKLILGSGVAADVTIESKDRGLSSEQAIKLGTVAGVAEALMESIGIDELLHMKATGKGRLLKSMLSEGLEELGTDVINTAFDAIISRDESQWNQSILAYMTTGESREQAEKLTLLDTMVQWAGDFAGGAISGGVFGGMELLTEKAGKGSAGTETKQTAVQKRQAALKARQAGKAAAQAPAAEQTAVQKRQAALKARQEGTAAAQTPAATERTAGITEQTAGITEQTAGITEQTAGITEQTAGITEQTPAATERTAVTTGQTAVQKRMAAMKDRQAGTAADRGEQTDYQQLRENMIQELGPRLKTPEEEQKLKRLMEANTELEISGVLSDAGEDQIQTARRLSELLGKKILFELGGEAENGWYVRSRDTIYLNPQSGNPVAQVIGHELTHSIEVAGEDYSTLRRIVSRRIEQSGDGMARLRDEKIDLYQRKGHALSDEEAEREVIAEYVEKNLLTDEQAIREMVRDSRSLAQRILDWLDGLLAKIGVKSSQERQFVLQARNAYRQALQESYKVHENLRDEKAQTQARMEAYAQGDDEAGDESFYEQWEHEGYVHRLLEDGDVDDVPFSFAGENAENADREALRQARQMEVQGMDAETIRQQTGWFRGMDGKWRWEIDDSKMQYTSRGDLGLRERRPEYARYRELLDKSNRYVLELSDEALTPEETAELQKLKDIWGGTFRKAGRITEDALPTDLLSDYVKHDDLFEAYPQLRKTRLRFADLPEGTRGRYDPEQDVITLSNSLRGKPQDTLIHEIQHAIQDREGFSPGASEGYWKQQRAEIVETISGARKNLDLWLEDIGYPQQLRESLLAVARREKTMEQHWQDMKAFKENSPYARQIAACEAELAEFQRQYDEITGGMTVYDQYRNTAGEIEARDSAQRRGLDPAGRKNTPPNLGDENTVFVQGRDVQEDRDVAVKQYSISDDSQTEQDDPVAALPWKAQQDLKKTERRLVNGVASSLDGTVKSAQDSEEVSGEYGDDGRNWIVDDETERKAREEGYPVIRGVQIVPYETWVLATDPITDEFGQAMRNMDGEIRRHHNYGKVVGLGAKRGTLRIHFWNKTAEKGVAVRNARKDKDIRIEDLSPVEGRYQMTDGELKSLFESAPSGMEREFTEEELREIEELRNRAEPGGEDLNTQPWKSVSVEDLPAKAQANLVRIERKLLGRVAECLEVPWKAKREKLQPIVREISQEFLRNGIVSQETADRLFEEAYKQGIVIDAEFYDTYKDVKTFLRTNPVTISEQDQGDIADFGAFRKRAMGTLRISKDGTPVDSMWRELQEMAPELFPDHITHPADQLQKMLEVGGSIRKVERALDEQYDKDFKAWAKNDFEAAVGEAVAKMRKVQRYGDAAKASREEQEHTDLTQEEVTALYPKLKETRRNYEKVLAKNLLTQEDQRQVSRLLRGEIGLEHLKSERDNVEGITAVYEAKMEYEKYAQQIRQWNRSRKAKLMAEAEKYTESANSWKDKVKGILYSRETMERNIRDIVPNKELAERIIDAYFKPVHDGAAQANRTKNEYRERIRALDISRKAGKGKVSEAYAVQLLGEAEDNIRVINRSRGRIKTRDGKNAGEWQAVIDKMWQENPQLDQAKIRNAVEEFRKIYNELFDQMNEARIRNGYEPVNYRQGYFPHFQARDEEGVMAMFGKALGIKTEVAALPTSINGLTHTFKPGIRWEGHALERKGFETVYDALEGFDRYIEGVADVIHQTDNIQRLRALAAQARYRTTDEGIKRQIDEIRARTDLPDTDKENRIKEIYENAKFALSNFVVELDEYTNLLANKKSRADRNMEQALGRDMYNLVKAWESRVAANMVAVNPGSWITNFIPLQQGAATLDKGLIWRGMWDTLKAIKTDDGFVDSSSFLTNRRGSDPLVRTPTQEASAWLSHPMEIIDAFTADSLVRARFMQNVKRGMSEAAAIEEADQWAAGVMADRSKGATPTLFNRNNPLTKLFTQFQLEVNNQLSYVAKDIPREAGMRDKAVAAWAVMMFKFMIGAYLVNDFYEEINGRRPALDPLGILNDTVSDIYGFEVPNVIDFIQGEDRDLRGEKVGASEALGNLGENVLEQLPFASALNVFGLDIDSARVPVASAIPDVNALINAGFNTEWSPERRWDTFKDELDNFVTSTVLPFGGSQVKKIIQGFKAVRDRGSYSVNTDGEEELQYPVHYTNGLDMLLTYAKAMTFGKSSFETAQEWVDSGFSGLGAKQTAAYKGMVELGEDSEAAYDLIVQIKDADKAEDETQSQQQRRILQESQLSPESKAIVYYQMMASEKELALMDSLNEADADMGEVTDVLMQIKDADKAEDETQSQQQRRILQESQLSPESKAIVYYQMMASEKELALMDSLNEADADMGEVTDVLMQIKDADSTIGKRSAILNSGLEEEEKIQIYTDRVSDTKGELIQSFAEQGLDFDEFLTVQNMYSEIDEMDMTAKQKATTFSSWINKQGYDSGQGELIRDSFRYWVHIPVEAGPSSS